MNYTTLESKLQLSWQNPSHLLRYAYRINRPLTVLGLSSILLLFICIVGLIIDPKTIIDEPAWRKPAKFAISITIYAFTFLWLLSFIQGRKWLISSISWITTIFLIGENLIISLQVIRGVRSHFNYTTPLDSALFGMMGLMILIVWIASLVAAILLIRQKMSDRSFGLSLKIGLVIAVIGAGLGPLMTSPNAEQMQEFQTGTTPQYLGSHSVGVKDGGAGLPVTGWSTEGGDLRIGHFVGMHAMQVLPLFGWLLMRNGHRLGERRRSRWIWASGTGYLGIVGIVTWQALRGQPLLQPDILTLAALALLIAVVGAMPFILSRFEKV